MNWFQKMLVAQNIPPTYTGIGHGYRWDEQKNQYQEQWQSPDRDPVLLWYYENGQIRDEVRGRTDQPHWSDSDDARGRVETGTGRGSVTFHSGDIDRNLQKRVLDALVDKYPGIRFSIYEPGGPYTMQQYWETIN